ncbi:MAG: DeoR family transcriptional regulator [Desulfitobacterium hafniense]|nr:DeoR family transcriptional regulator [Desulfitobacterium hafniense]
MNQLVVLQQKIVPELIELVERRYNILRYVHLEQPLGRRVLAARLELGERAVRNEVEFLKAQGLMTTDQAGMWITPEGEELLDGLADYVRQLKGLTRLEDELVCRLGIERVVIVPGDADRDEGVKKEIGRVAAALLKEYLQDEEVIAVTGGSTTLAVAQGLMPEKHGYKALVVPARGGLGEDVELQANTIAAALARKLGGGYRMLHIPDYLSEETVATLLNEPRIKRVVDLIRSADIVIHGIGCAQTMAVQRGLNSVELEGLLAKGAVGEAFGNYFDPCGRVVGGHSSIGIRLEELAQVGRIIGVAGGASKGEAIMAVVAGRPNQVLVTDQAAAENILKA